MKDKKFDDASTQLSEALDMSFARMETGFVMAELLRQRVQFEPSAAVYAQILRTLPDFPNCTIRPVMFFIAWATTSLR
jgi:hypothetical protein